MDRRRRAGGRGPAHSGDHDAVLRVPFGFLGEPFGASPDDLEDFSDLFPGASASASATAGADEPEGIPDLSVMDVLGNLKNYPTRSGFACVGPVPGDGNDPPPCGPARPGPKEVVAAPTTSSWSAATP